MKTHYTRNIIVAVLITFAAIIGLLNLQRGAEMLTASTAVVLALGTLGVLEMRQGAGSYQRKKAAKKRSHA